MFRTGAMIYLSKKNILSLGALLFNPLTPGTFLQKMRFLDTLATFRLDLGQITFNPVKSAFAAQQLAFLATSIAF